MEVFLFCMWQGILLFTVPFTEHSRTLLTLHRIERVFAGACECNTE